MDLQDWVGLVAIIGVIGGFYLTWRGQNQDKGIAEATASRAEAAARITDANTERVVAALEEIARKDFTASVAMASPPPPRVRWELERASGEQFILTNLGDATAYDVQVTAHESMGGLINVTGGPDLEPDGVVTFIAAPSLATSDYTITVSWLDHPAATERRQWQYPLPTR